MAATILVAFDESPQATAALHHALSTYDNATIRVLYVNDPWEWAGADGIDGVFYAEEAFERSQEVAEEVIATAEEIAREYGTEVTTESEVGAASETIVAYAEEHNVDHIVLGSHGRRGLERFLLGSVAERVVKRSPGSVTIIRDEPPDGDE
ncbi:universal stress protein [Haloterrigena sp. SYSU A121-1]|uniref:Universal stress protein n=1 Tax=Haloterrigena gelatinilytica TaxID=2741724 RepID=A0A8J8GS79_9EURY|nr:universal stress protein [Haloterrigena gelatinilytica]NUB93549.1 universal stress protein [Haloterrigena gelatinilytica]